jgi:galactosamine-6-phosphate isomerase
MVTTIFSNYESLSDFTAAEWINFIKANPNATICVASGDSPKLACELFCEKVKEHDIDVSKFFFLGLDEWVGLSPETFGSCHNDFQKRLIQPLGLVPSQYHMFDALATDLETECSKMDAVIKSRGGIDLMIVGIGMNGHIGFNEPGVAIDLLSHVIELDETTLSVGQKYFKEKTVLQKGITLGLQHLMNAKKVFLLANGERKAAVIQKAAEGDVNNQFPASIMQQHENGLILVDEAAASLLNKQPE